jgi:hypothetical protein
MSAPVLTITDQELAFTALLESIALEEVALAHFINAEAEKVQEIAGIMNGDNSDTVIDLQRSVVAAMQTAIKMQMLLQFKLENVLEAKMAFELNNNEEPEPVV